MARRLSQTLPKTLLNGRLRTSTLLLSALFVALLALYLEVRPGSGTDAPERSTPPGPVSTSPAPRPSITTPPTPSAPPASTPAESTSAPAPTPTPGSATPQPSEPTRSAPPDTSATPNP